MIMMTMMASIDNENNDKYNDDNSDYESINDNNITRFDLNLQCLYNCALEKTLHQVKAFYKPNRHVVNCGGISVSLTRNKPSHHSLNGLFY